jgi:hypothetical protein
MRSPWARRTSREAFQVTLDRLHQGACFHLIERGQIGIEQHLVTAQHQNGALGRGLRAQPAPCLASALKQRGIAEGDTVAAMLPNVPALYEAHFGVPMTGAVLNTPNTRLDAETIAFMLDHAEAWADAASRTNGYCKRNCSTNCIVGSPRTGKKSVW